MDLRSQEGCNALSTHRIFQLEVVVRIELIVKDPQVGEEYEGKVVGIQSFGAFVKITPSKDGLLHISRIANGRIGSVEDALAIGDTVKVRVIEVDSKTGKINLDRLDKPDAPAGSGSGGGYNGGGNRSAGNKGGEHPGRSGHYDKKPRRQHRS